MPNISFDIFFDQDIINITATRSQTTPRVKPSWKVRSAPKLPAKEGPDRKTAAFGPKRLTNSTPATGATGKAATPGTAAAKSAATATTKSDATAATDDASAPKKKIPKLPPKSKTQAKAPEA